MLHVSQDDNDVRAERARVERGGANKDVIRVENLSKVFSRGNYHAVDHLSFGIPRGECFGLVVLQSSFFC